MPDIDLKTRLADLDSPPCAACQGSGLVLSSPQLDSLLTKLSEHGVSAVQMARKIGVGEGTLSKQRRGEAAVNAAVVRGVIESCVERGLL